MGESPLHVVGREVRYGGAQGWGLRYELVQRGERLGIRCGGCGLTSWHPEDVRNLYCANCKRFHDDPDPSGVS